MNNHINRQNTIEIEPYLYALLQRCSKIESRQISEIIASLLGPHLEKYAHNTLEQWEDARDVAEMKSILQDFAANDNFNPNEIPFNTQILGLRRKLDELEKEIHTSQTPRPDLEKVKFAILEDLNFAEKNTLQQQQDAHFALSKKWRSTCKEFPLPYKWKRNP